MKGGVSLAKQMIRECVECNHRQIGYSDRDGDSCVQCGAFAVAKGWAHTGVDLAKKEDSTAYVIGSIDELHEYGTPEQARRAILAWICRS